MQPATWNNSIQFDDMTDKSTAQKTEVYKSNSNTIMHGMQWERTFRQAFA